MVSHELMLLMTQRMLAKSAQACKVCMYDLAESFYWLTLVSEYLCDILYCRHAVQIWISELRSESPDWNYSSATTPEIEAVTPAGGEAPRIWPICRVRGLTLMLTSRRLWLSRNSGGFVARRMDDRAEEVRALCMSMLRSASLVLLAVCEVDQSSVDDSPEATSHTLAFTLPTSYAFPATDLAECPTHADS